MDDGIWQARQERRPKEILNPESNVMQRGCVDCDLEQAWASWQASEDAAFTSPFSDASGQGAMLLGRWDCRQRPGVWERNLMFMEQQIYYLSESLFYEGIKGGEDWKLRWLMADSAQDRITEQGVNCLTPSLSPALVIALDFFIETVSHRAHIILELIIWLRQALNLWQSSRFHFLITGLSRQAGLPHLL